MYVHAHKHLLLYCPGIYPCSGTNRYFRRIAVNAGLTNTLVEATDMKKVEEAIKENTKVGSYKMYGNRHS